MGMLDGGRGLAAAAFGSALVFAVAALAPDLSTTADQRLALQVIYGATITFTLLIAVGIWISLSNFENISASSSQWNFKKTLECLKDIRVWLLSLVVLGSYCGYKGIDNYSIYLVDVYGMDLESSSLFTSIIFWLRPLAALVTGFVADKLHRRHRSGRFLILFALLFLGGLSQLLLAYNGFAHFYYGFAVIVLSAGFAYALRAIYFSVFGDLEIPSYLIGTVTGIVSFVGFAPDIFFGLVTGRLIDSYPGLPGFQYAFVFTGLCLLAGAMASLMLWRKSVH